MRSVVPCSGIWAAFDCRLSAGVLAAGIENPPITTAPEPRRRPPPLLGLNGNSAGLDVGGRRVTANPWAGDVRVGLQRGGEIGH